MSTTELFATSIVAAFFLGAYVGAIALSVMYAIQDRRDRDRARAARREIRKITDHADRMHWRAQHLGTPYREQTVADARIALAQMDALRDLWPDTHNGSRKAPAPLTVVRAQTGRPA